MNSRILLLVALVVGIAGAMVWVFAFLGDDLPIDAGPVLYDAPAETTKPADLLPTGNRVAETLPSENTREAFSGTFTVRGMVRDSSDEPLVGRQAVVELFGPAKKEVRIGPEGQYTLENLAAGRYTLTFRARGCETVRLDLPLEGRARVIERDVVLARHRLIVVHMSSSDGLPLVDALKQKSASLGNTIAAVATIESPPTWFEDIPTQGQELAFGVGTFTTRKDPSVEYERNFAGELTVRADGPCYVSVVFNKAVLAKRRVDAAETVVDFILSVDEILSTLGVVQARVVQAGSGKLLRATPMVARALQAPGFRHTHTTGQVEWKGLWAGKQLLRISTPGHAQWSREVELEPREVLDLGTIEITQGNDLQATVVGPGGLPVAAAFVVTRINPGTGVADPNLAQAAGSNAEGKMLVRSLEPLHYLLHTRGRGKLASGPVLVDMTGGPVADLVITLQASTLVTIRPGAGFRWYRLEAGGHTIQNGIPLPQGFTVQLIPGSYELVLGDQTGERDRRKFEVGTTPLTVE